jgi:hypothetical protein
MGLSDIEIGLLRTLLKGYQPLMTPAQHLRLATLGLLRESPSGFVLTAAGRQTAVSAFRAKLEILAA